jgi:hypothetical protein
MAAEPTILLTKENVSQAAVRANNYESFGRAVVAHVMQTAARSKLDTELATVPLEFTLRPSLSPGRDPTLRTVCIDLCIGPVCIHVVVDQ